MDNTYWAAGLSDLRVAYRARIDELLGDIEALLDGIRELPCCRVATPLEAIRSRVHSLNTISIELNMTDVTHVTAVFEELCDNLLEADVLEGAEWARVEAALDTLRQVTASVYEMADAA